jgi:5-(carboxyamino)imidazole ribonucleotide mutase
VKRVLVLFGSQSDDYVFNGINETLSKNFEVDFHILSAHRNPEDLRKLIEKDEFDFIVAGAGLAAHLPGVCASLTKKPVFGIPVEAAFGGLDAYLSIVQMPFGVPVGAIDAQNITELSSMIPMCNKKEICVVVKSDIANNEYILKEMKRLKELSEELEVRLLETHQVSETNFNIVLHHSDSDFEVLPNTFNVPVFPKNELSNSSLALRTMDLFNRGGIWFGTNNSRNALLQYSMILKGNL